MQEQTQKNMQTLKRLKKIHLAACGRKIFPFWGGNQTSKVFDHALLGYLHFKAWT